MRWLRLAWLVPPLLLVAFVWHYGVDLPWFDQWELPPLIEKWGAGTLGLADLWSQHNEHRPFVPRLVMLGLAALSHWNIRWELAASVAFAGGTFAVIAARLRRDGFVLAVASLLVFSLTQKENWLWGWQLQILLAVLAGVGALGILAREQVGARGVAAAAALSVVASFSFGNGMALFPVGALVLWRVGRARPALLAILLGTGAAAIALYLRGYHAVGDRGYALHHPLGALAYLLAYLGSPLGFGNAGVAAAIGAAGVLGFGWLLRTRTGTREATAFALGLAGWAGASAVITAASRAGLGFAQATNSRYVTVSTLFWVGLLVLAAEAERLRRPIAGVVALLAVLCWIQSVEWAVYDSLERRAVRDLLRQDPEHGLLRVMPWDDRPRLRPRLEFLRAHRLSLFRQ